MEGQTEEQKGNKLPRAAIPTYAMGRLEAMDVLNGKELSPKGIQTLAQITIREVLGRQLNAADGLLVGALEEAITRRRAQVLEGLAMQ